MHESKKELADRLEKIRLKHRNAVAAWRKKSPQKNREIYILHFRKKRGYYLVSERDSKNAKSI